MRTFSMICGVALLLALLLPGCNLFNRPPTITSVSWWTDNVHPAYFGPDPPATLFRGFQVQVSDPDGHEDIVSVTVTDPNGRSWDLTGDYDAEADAFGGWLYHDPESPDAVPLGEYTVLVSDSEEHSASSTVTFTAPGSAEGTGFIYVEEGYDGSTAGGTKALYKGRSVSGGRTPTSVQVSFYNDDARVVNCLVWFFTGDGAFICSTGYLLDLVNDGEGINSDGSANDVEIPLASLELGQFTADDISGFHVILTDGEQYAPETEVWDHRSFSDLGSL